MDPSFLSTIRFGNLLVLVPCWGLLEKHWPRYRWRFAVLLKKKIKKWVFSIQAIHLYIFCIAKVFGTRSSALNYLPFAWRGRGFHYTIPGGHTFFKTRSRAWIIFLDRYFFEFRTHHFAYRVFNFSGQLFQGQKKKMLPSSAHILLNPEIKMKRSDFKLNFTVHKK